MPTPSARPDSDRILKVMPVKYISTMANSTLNGILMATTMVGRRSFRNSASTMMASARALDQVGEHAVDDELDVVALVDDGRQVQALGLGHHRLPWRRWPALETVEVEAVELL